MSRREFNEHNLATIRLDQFPPDHLVDRIVGALDQNLGRTRRMSSMGVSSSKMTTASTASRADKTSARACLVLHRPAGAFEALDGCIAVEPHDKMVACATRLRQQFDVPGMQQIETPIGKTNAAIPLRPQFRQLLVEDRPIVDDLFLARQGRSRQGTRPQFSDRHSRDTAFLPTTTDARRIGGSHRCSRSMPAASITDSVATTVSPAPETSRTLTG